MDTVALIFSDQPPVIIPYDIANVEYNALRTVTLTEPQDEQLLAALVAALGVLPPPVMGKALDGRSHAENKIEQWRTEYADLQSK